MDLCRFFFRTLFVLSCTSRLSTSFVTFHQKTQIFQVSPSIMPDDIQQRLKHGAFPPAIHIYIYIYAVELITWPFFGHFRVNNLAMVELITWPSFFEPIKIGVLGDFLVHSYEGGGAKLVFLEKEFGQKKVFGQKNAPFFLVGFGFTSLLLHDCH